MRRTLEVVDDFYRQPLWVRELARALGDGDVWDLHQTQISSSDRPIEGIARILGLSTDRCASVEASAYVTAMQGESATRGRAVEIPEGWTGVVWLSLPEEFSGGIWFWPRGWAAGEVSPSQYSGSETDQRRSEECRDVHDIYVQAKFNRLVLFRESELAHRCGTNGHNVRGGGWLAQVFCLSERLSS